jgi:hypothetical protein
MTDDYVPDADDAEPDTEHRMSGFPTPDLNDCPIAFLGEYGENVVFAMPSGIIRSEKSADIARKIKLDIFNSRAGQQFLGHWRDAEDKFQRELAALWFIRQARDAGFWDASRPQRSLGVWPGSNRSVVLHRGRELIVYPADPDEDCRTIPIAAALRDRRGPIYAVRAETPEPAEGSTADDGRWLRDALDCWHWDAIGDDGLSGADVICGWMGASLLGAVAPFRPHSLIYALMGSGKTTLISLVHGALSALAGDVLDSFTRAGLANELGGHARPVIIDEAEASAAVQGLGPIEEALDLIRKMATGSGAVRKMGTIGGGSVTQTAVGAVMMAAINPVKLGPADASRIAEVKLLPLELARSPGSAYRPTSSSAIEEMIRRAQELSTAFLGRALDDAQRYLADVVLLKAAFLEQGENSRGADLVAALAAGRLLLTSDEPLTASTAADEALFWRGLNEVRQAAEMVSNPGADCLAHLMNWQSGQHLHDRIVTLGELVSRWVRGSGSGSTEDLSDIVAVLREHGLKIQNVADERGQRRPWLLVAHHAPGLDRIFDRTTWKDWRRTLAYLDALGPEFKTRAGKPQYFGIGVRQRCTAVPLDPWIDKLSGNGALQSAADERYAHGDEFT